jgi:hypothetical protein
VLPLVASTRVAPGCSRPAASAAWIMDRAGRSFTLPAGLRNSGLAPHAGARLRFHARQAHEGRSPNHVEHALSHATGRFRSRRRWRTGRRIGALGHAARLAPSEGKRVIHSLPQARPNGLPSARRRCASRNRRNGTPCWNATRQSAPVAQVKDSRCSAVTRHVHALMLIEMNSFAASVPTESFGSSARD